MIEKDIIVHIEDVVQHKQGRDIIIDFINREDYNEFIDCIGLKENFRTEGDSIERSMIKIENYKGRKIKKDSYYTLQSSFFKEHNKTFTRSDEGFTIGYNINLKNNPKKIFTKYKEEPVFPITGVQSINNEYFYFRSILSMSLGYGNTKINVKNTGQGNWIEIYQDAKIVGVFDIGTSLTESDIVNVINNTKENYSKSRPILVISHWHTDHYNILTQFSLYEIKQCFSAIVCRKELPNLTALNIIEAFQSHGLATCLISPEMRSKGPLKFKKHWSLSKLNHDNDVDYSIQLFNGENHSNKNNSGLIIKIETVNKVIVLPGDATYKQVVRDVLSEMSPKDQKELNLVVPHHGGEAGRYPTNEFAFFKCGQAIISVGKNNIYKHPLVKNVDFLKKSGFQLERTDEIGRDFTFYL